MMNRLNRLAPKSKSAIKVTTSEKVKEGMTLVTFLGRGSNPRPFYGQDGTRYLFGGRHNIGNIFNRDLAFMLKMTENGKPLFAIVKTVEPTHPPAPVIAAVPEAVVKPKRVRKPKVA